MTKLRIGVIGCSEFAGRAMIPAMVEMPEIDLIAIASRKIKKAREFSERFNCEAIEGYSVLLNRTDISLVYVPLPPGLHDEWIARSLEAGKHILVEKSFVQDRQTGKRLIDLARSKNLLIVENFLFPHHSQYSWVRERIATGVLGDVHSFRSNFSIPKLKPDNFRYSAELGGGALLDLGAYMIKSSRLFLGNELSLVGATLRYDKTLGVDMAGTATFANKAGQTAQVVFDLDSYYQNNWEFAGNKGKLIAERAYTPPPGFSPVVRIERNNYREEFTLPPDNHYINKLRHVVGIISGHHDFEPYWKELEIQSRYIDLIRKEAIRL